jgi:predicted O-methyltransferase YrrM
MVSAFNEVLGRMAAERESGVVEIVRESDSIYIPSITDESLDWVYIDADHRYESVLNDLRLVYPKVKHGGIIAGHDFVYSVKDGDVIYAVLDFLKETPGLMLEAISGQPGARSYMTRKA